LADLDLSDEPPELVRPGPPRSWRERAGELADATGTTPTRLAAGAVLIAIAVVVGLWLTRPPSLPPEVSLPFASTTAVGVATTGTSSPPEDLVVHVAGAVARPGVLHLRPGARVVDAIDAAGGLAPEADGARINLAAPVADGTRVYVPAVGEALPAAVGTEADGDGAAAGPVDLNTADEAALDALPGIGPATAKAIVAHRAEIGRFTSVDQLLDVRGIGPAKLEELRPLVTV
jgi:competence protein ComEA